VSSAKKIAAELQSRVINTENRLAHERGLAEQRLAEANAEVEKVRRLFLIYRLCVGGGRE
jgi:hypothetical protein